MPISGAWLASTPIEPVVVRDEHLHLVREHLALEA